VYDLLSSSSSASHKHRDKSYYFKAALSNDAPGHVAHPPADVVTDVAVGVSLTDHSNNSSTNSNSSSTEQQLSIEVPLAINEEEVLISAYGDPVASHSRANSDAPDAAIAATSTYAGKQLVLVYSVFLSARPWLQCVSTQQAALRIQDNFLFEQSLFY
jgi:hypothetical protein